MVGRIGTPLALAITALGIAGCGPPRFGLECRVDAETCARAVRAVEALDPRPTGFSAIVVPPVPVQIGIGRWSLGSDVAGIVYRDVLGEVVEVVMVGGRGPTGDHAWRTSGRWAAAYEAAAR